MPPFLVIARLTIQEASRRREAAACLGDFVGLEPTVIEGFPATIWSLALHPRAEQVAIGLTNGGVLTYRCEVCGTQPALAAIARARLNALRPR